MKRVFFVFALAVAFGGLTPVPAAAQETCSQARNACQANCNRGWGGQSPSQKNACTADCGGRFNECLQTGTWRNYRPTIPSRHGLIKR